jgi:hypothetical protein
VPESPDLKGLDWKQIDASLRRLHGYGFIAGSPGPAGETGTIWSKLRIRAQGLQQLDEWPDLDRIASALGMEMMLDELARATSDAGKKSLLAKVAGFARRFGDRFIRSSADAAATETGKALGRGL